MVNVYTDNNLTPEPWTRQALCAETAPDAFFPEPYDRHAAEAAKRVCAQCPVQAECLAFALRTNQQEGIWGGLTRGQRQKLRRTA